MLNQRRRFIWNLRKRFIGSLQRRTGLRNNLKFDQLQGSRRERKKRTGHGEKKIINRGDLTEEAKVWFYFLASVLIPTKHVCIVREQEAVLLYAILKGYKVNAGAIIENSIMKYHEGNRRGLIPYPTTIT